MCSILVHIAVHRWVESIAGITVTSIGPIGVVAILVAIVRTLSTLILICRRWVRSFKFIQSDKISDPTL